MSTLLRVLLVVALATLASTAGWSADGVVARIDFSEASRAPSSLVVIANLVLYGGTTLVFLYLAIWAVRHAADANYKPSLILFGGMFLVAIVISIFFSGSGAFSWSAGEEAPSTTGFEWAVYGQDSGSATHFPSQAFSYEHQRGWALSGAVYFFRMLDFCYASMLLPILALGGVLYAVWLAKVRQDVWPLAAHCLALLFVFPICCIPAVRYASPTDGNIMFSLLAQSAREGGGDVVDQPRVTPFMASTFGVLTEVTQKFGEAISWGNTTPTSVVVQAGLDARLSNGDLEQYMEYSSFCFTAVRNALDKKTDFQKDPSYATWYQDLVGTAATTTTPAGNLGKFGKAPLAMKYALSPYADAIFKDVLLSEWVLCSQEDRAVMRLAGTNAVVGIPSAYQYHPNPAIGSGHLASVTANEANDRLKVAGDSSWTGEAWTANEPRMDFLFPTVYSLKRLISANSYVLGPHRYFVPYCSVKTPTGSFENLDTLANDTSFPANFAQVTGDDLAPLKPLALNEGLRVQIAKQYLGGESNDFCKGVSPDRSNEHLWGCLIAGKYNVAPTNDRERTMFEYQQAFDNQFRPMIEAAVKASYDAVGGTDGFAQERDTGETTYWKTGTYTLSDAFVAPLVERNFIDVLFAAPGIQSQIGMFGDYRASVAKKENGNSDNWFFKWVVGIGGAIKPGIAGAFEFIGVLFSKVALMIYPHVLGVMSFLLMLLSLPYVLRCVLPGQYLVCFVWASGVLVVALMQVSVQIGLSFIETGNNVALPAFFLRSSAGGEFGETLLRLVGVFFIASAFSVATAFVSYGFGSIAGVLANINRTSFQLTGAGVAGAITISGIGAAALLKGGALLALGQKALEGAKKLDGGGGGGDTQPNPTLPRPGGNLPGPTAPGAGPTSSTRPVIGSGEVGHSANTTQRVHSPNSMGDQTSHQARNDTMHQMLGTAGHAATSAASGAVTMLQAGSMMAEASGGFAQGGQLGVGAAQRAWETGSQMVGAGISGAVAARNWLASKYAGRRGNNGQLPASVQPDDADAQGFSRIGQTYEYDAEQARLAGNAAQEQAALRQAGMAYEDAARLSETPQGAGEFGLRSAAAYLKAGDWRSAPIDETRAAFQRSASMATTARERGDAQLGISQAEALAFVRYQQQASADPSIQRNPGTDAQYLDRVHAPADDAQVSFSQAAADAYPVAAAQNSPEAWAAYGAPLVNRLRAAQLGSTGPGIPEAMVDAVGREAKSASIAGNRNAAAVYAGMLATSDRQVEAGQVLREAGYQVSDDELATLRRDLLDGRFTALEALLRKKG